MNEIQSLKDYKKQQICTIGLIMLVLLFPLVFGSLIVILDVWLMKTSLSIGNDEVLALMVTVTVMPTLFGFVLHCFSLLLECINEVKWCNEQMTHMTR